MQWKCKRVASIVFRTIHSSSRVVVLLDKHFRSLLSTFCNSISSITNCMYAAISESNITAYVKKIRSLVWSQIIASNFSSMPIVFRRFFTLTALGDVDFTFLTPLGRKPSIVEGGTTSPATLCHQRNQQAHVTDGVQWRHFLLATDKRLRPQIVCARSR
jgi:hypothetical protein